MIESMNVLAINDRVPSCKGDTVHLAVCPDVVLDCRS